MRTENLFNNLETFFSLFGDQDAVTGIAQDFRFTAKEIAGSKAFGNHISVLKSMYEKAAGFIERRAADSGFDPELLLLQHNLYLELEYILSFGGCDDRYNFLLVIPVADRPVMLKNCIDSVIEQCRLFQYGGFTVDNDGTPFYNKVGLLVFDDSRDEANRNRIRELCWDAEDAGIRTHYVGLEEQACIVNQIPPDLKEKLAGIIGHHQRFVGPHKGASITRNIAFLYIAAMLNEDTMPGEFRFGRGMFPRQKRDKTLIWFLDSDEEFMVKVHRKGVSVNIPFINYFYRLDTIFQNQDIEVLTGKVTGDPPVSPAVMINTFLDDMIFCLENFSKAGASGKCCFHEDRPAKPFSAEYHDMVKLFGYDGDGSPQKYNCCLHGAHAVNDCLQDFSRRALGFFYGLHPTRTQLYMHEDSVRTDSARTVYTGNYVFRPSGLKFFIPFAVLKLRMAGPALGRILRKRIKQGFVSCNLPLLHRRTIEMDYSNEFRSGIYTENNAPDLSVEYSRQFWGDVMLFSIESLVDRGYPDKPFDLSEITGTVCRTKETIWDLYRTKQAETAAKITAVREIVACPDRWWNRFPASSSAAADLMRFCDIAESNFGHASSGIRMIADQIAEGSPVDMTAGAIKALYQDDILWSEALNCDIAVPERCEDTLDAISSD